MRASKRRFGESSHDLGRYSAKSIGTCSFRDATLRLTPIWQLVTLPADPVYWRCTPTEWGPLLEEARVVDDPRRHRLALGHRRDRVSRGLQLGGHAGQRRVGGARGAEGGAGQGRGCLRRRRQRRWFAPVRVRRSAVPPLGEMVVEVGGARIRVFRGADMTLLGEVVRALQGGGR
jgi:hypothetical protein